ncbi:MAG: SRPBCC family protein [Gemmatimonadota bacterium]
MARALKLAGVVVAIPALLIALMAAIGSTLPVAHVATRSVALTAPPESVFAVVSHFVAAASWRSDLDSVTLIAPGQPAEGRLGRFREFGDNGAMTLEVVESTSPARLVTKIVDEGPFGGAWVYQVTPQGAGSRLTITEHGEVFNPWFRFVSRFVIGHAATLERYLTDVARRFGVVTVIESATAIER